MNLRIDFLAHPVTTLGPGARALVAFAGCARGCPGCIARHAQDGAAATRMSLREVAQFVATALAGGACGLTVTGGEPFEQPEALHALLVAARAAGCRDRLVYSGFTRAELERNHPGPLSEIDALVDGPFLRERPAAEPWRGSANQAFHLLTRDPEIAARYDAYLARRPARRALQLVEAPGGMRLVGIPDPADAERILDEFGPLAEDLPHLRDGQ